MLRIFVEEAAALASITLFVGMVAVWAQLFSQFVDFVGPCVGEKRDGAADLRHRRGLLRREAAPSFGESALRSLNAPQAPK